MKVGAAEHEVRCRLADFGAIRHQSKMLRPGNEGVYPYANSVPGLRSHRPLAEPGLLPSTMRMVATPSTDTVPVAKPVAHQLNLSALRLDDIMTELAKCIMRGAARAFSR